MPTANVVTTQTGTGFTINVTACNLLTDTTVKDFYVLHNGSLFCNGQTDGCSAYAKSTPTSVQYSGAALAANTTVEVRRFTPRAVLQVINYGNRFSSSTWNSELDRGVRRSEEYDLNGVGPGTIQQIATPSNVPYPTGWSTNIINPPTQAVLYTILSTLAPLSSPTFTGTPVAPTPSTADSSTKLATTNYVQNNLTNYAALSGASFSVNPTAPNNNQYDQSTNLSTASFVQNLYRPCFRYTRGAVTSSNSGNTQLTFGTLDFDTDGTWVSNAYTTPSSAAGHYVFYVTIYVTNNQASIQPIGMSLYINGTAKTTLSYFSIAASGGSAILMGSALVYLNVGDVVTFYGITSSTAWTFGSTASASNVVSGHRLGT